MIILNHIVMRSVDSSWPVLKQPYKNGCFFCCLPDRNDTIIQVGNPSIPRSSPHASYHPKQSG
jgi:hypothetical protein